MEEGLNLQSEWCNVPIAKKFSVIPSFISREKHYSVDVIGMLLEGVLLRGVCIQYAQKSIGLTSYPVKSKQTVFNWIKWLSFYHPAELLEKAGAKGNGYLQEDEGFQKEPSLRTYIPVIVDPNSQAVWHIDYIDHVDEDTLFQSFEDFLDKISFKVKGITKDKWQASNNALKRLFNNLWIGYCHLHCQKKFQQALKEYRKDTGISVKESEELYRKFSDILENSTHGTDMLVKANMLEKEEKEAFSHPALKKRLDELKENSINYTRHKEKKGMTKTTSIVDNFLKNAKRKLREAMSFRTPESAKEFFRSMGNVRNFLPFTTGSKNAHKSPFMLSGGEAYNLPWMQVINVYNGFLFV